MNRVAAPATTPALPIAPTAPSGPSATGRSVESGASDFGSMLDAEAAREQPVAPALERRNPVRPVARRASNEPHRANANAGGGVEAQPNDTVDSGEATTSTGEAEVIPAGGVGALVPASTTAVPVDAALAALVGASSTPVTSDPVVAHPTAVDTAATVSAHAPVGTPSVQAADMPVADASTPETEPPAETAVAAAGDTGAEPAITITVTHEPAAPAEPQHGDATATREPATKPVLSTEPPTAELVSDAVADPAPAADAPAETAAPADEPAVEAAPEAPVAEVSNEPAPAPAPTPTNAVGAPAVARATTDAPAAASASVATPPPAPAAEGTNVLRQAEINRLAGGTQRVDVELDTAHLGRVRVEAVDQRGAVAIQIHADRPDTRVVLDQQLAGLHAELAGGDVRHGDARAGREQHAEHAGDAGRGAPTTHPNLRDRRTPVARPVLAATAGVDVYA